MGTARLSLRGDRKLARQLRQLRGDTSAIAHQAVRAWGLDVRDTARQLAPRRTGRLRSNISLRVAPGAHTASVGTHGSYAFYGHFLEHGTSKMAAQPWLGPAETRHRGEIRRYVRKAVEDHLP